MNTSAAQGDGTVATHIKSLSESARILVQNGDLRGAEDVYRAILDAAPYHGPALSFFARQANDAGDPAKALEFIEKAIKGNPGKLVHIQNRAKLYGGMGRLQDALNDLDLLLKQRPDAFTLLFHKALVLRDLGKRKEAVRTAIAAWQRCPNPEALVGAPDVPAYLGSQIFECANLIRATQLMYIDGELKPVVEQHGKEALQRIFAAVSTFTGLHGTHANPELSGLVLAGVNGYRAPKPAPDWLTGIEAAMGRLIHAANEASRHAARGARDQVQVISIQAAGLDTLLASLEPTVPLIRDMDTETRVMEIPAGTHVIRTRSAENWKLTVYLPIEVANDATLAQGTDVHRLSAGIAVVANPSSDDIVRNDGPASVCLMRFSVWHPETTLAEQQGLQAVYRAMKRFDDHFVRQS